MLLPFFLIMGRGGRNKLKTHLNTVLTPRLAGTQMTLNVVAIYLYCLHSFQTPVKQQPAAPKRALMPLTNSVQRHSRLNFLGIPPSSKKQHVTSPLDMGKSCTKSLFQSQIHSIFCFTLFVFIRHNQIQRETCCHNSYAGKVFAKSRTQKFSWNLSGISSSLQRPCILQHIFPSDVPKSASTTAKLQWFVWTPWCVLSNHVVRPIGASGEDTWPASSCSLRFDWGAHRTRVYQDMYTVKIILTVLSSELQSWDTVYLFIKQRNDVLGNL